MTLSTSIRIQRTNRIAEQQRRDPDDVLDVARDVGVLAGLLGGERARRRRRPSSRVAARSLRPLAGVLGGALLGEHLRPRARPRARARPPTGRSGAGSRGRPRATAPTTGTALDGPALAGTDAASSALRHGWDRASGCRVGLPRRRGVRRRLEGYTGARGRAAVRARRGECPGSADCYARAAPAPPEDRASVDDLNRLVTRSAWRDRPRARVRLRGAASASSLVLCAAHARASTAGSPR